jgi:hypothetical protein
LGAQKHKTETEQTLRGQTLLGWKKFSFWVECVVLAHPANSPQAARKPNINDIQRLGIWNKEM